MEIATIIEIISTLGFPIGCVIALAAFVYVIYRNTTKENKENLVEVQARSKEREDKLYMFLEDSAEINAKFAEIIARYETKLDEIKQDVKDIKTEVIEIKSQH